MCAGASKSAHWEEGEREGWNGEGTMLRWSEEERWNRGGIGQQWHMLVSYPPSLPRSPDLFPQGLGPVL